MPARIGDLDLPRRSSHFLKLRVAVRPYLSECIHVGLSGGPDSLALVAAARAEGAAVRAICIDHGLQEGSAEVSETAALVARSMGARAEVVRIDARGPGSTESAARVARYRAFSESVESIWVGHTMDDQAETYLLGALRGNPAGMLDRSRQGGLEVIRPLLTVRRQDTVAACAELGLHPWQDPHNQELSFRRVGVRTRVLPLLEEIHEGDPVPALALAATRAAEDAALLDAGVDKRRDEWADGFPVKLAEEPEALRRRMIADFLRAHGGTVGARQITAVDKLLTDWHGQGGVAVGGTATRRLEVVRENGKLRIIG